jgi:hypothetical protein
MTIERERLKAEEGLRTRSRGMEWFCFGLLYVPVSTKSTIYCTYVAFGIKLTFGWQTTFDLSR